MPSRDSFAMTEHLREIRVAVYPGCRAVLILDQAGWRTSQKLVTLENTTLPPLPYKAQSSTSGKSVAGDARQLAIQPHLQIL